MPIKFGDKELTLHLGTALRSVIPKKTPTPAADGGVLANPGGLAANPRAKKSYPTLELRARVAVPVATPAPNPIPVDAQTRFTEQAGLQLKANRATTELLKTAAKLGQLERQLAQVQEQKKGLAPSFVAGSGDLKGLEDCGNAVKANRRKNQGELRVAEKRPDDLGKLEQKLATVRQLIDEVKTERQVLVDAQFAMNAEALLGKGAAAGVDMAAISRVLNPEAPPGDTAAGVGDVGATKAKPSALTFQKNEAFTRKFEKPAEVLGTARDTKKTVVDVRAKLMAGKANAPTGLVMGKAISYAVSQKERFGQMEDMSRAALQQVRLPDLSRIDASRLPPSGQRMLIQAQILSNDMQAQINSATRLAYQRISDFRAAKNANPGASTATESDYRSYGLDYLSNRLLEEVKRDNDGTVIKNQDGTDAKGGVLTQMKSQLAKIVTRNLNEYAGGNLGGLAADDPVVLLAKVLDPGTTEQVLGKGKGGA